MKILHTYCLNYNIGDYALGIGLKNLMRNYLDVDLIGNTNIQGRVFNSYYINEVVNKRYDLLVIGGGGIIHGAHWPNGWFWLIDQDLIKEIKIPFIIYGVGFNFWKEEECIPNRTIKHLQETINYAKYFSVRNDGSKKRLFEQTGINVPAIPDPGFHINLNTLYNRPLEEPFVIIQLANDKASHRFGSNENKKRFVSEMRILTKELSQRYKVIFAPHVLDDLAISQEISQDVRNTAIWDFGYFAFDHVEKAIAYYKYADFVIAMRGHGQIIPIAFNTPVIAIENHPKHKGLMEELGLLSYSLNFRETHFLQKLNQAVDKIHEERAILKEKYMKINKHLLEDSNFAFRQITQAIS